MASGNKRLAAATLIVSLSPLWAHAQQLQSNQRPTFLLPSAIWVQAERIVVRPEDTGKALRNPGMGWGFHYYSNVPANYGSKLQPSDTLKNFPGLTHIYLRIPWAFLEPQENRFDWQALDIPAQRWIDAGKQIALRISCSESWMRYATPQWVERAGAKGYNFTVGKGVDPNGPFWEPDYRDPVFLEKLDHFLSAMAARYDGSDEVAFIDIGSFGVWGEGHTWASSKLPFDYETRKIHVDLYSRHFKKTLVAINDDFAGPGDRAGRFDITDYALSKGMTLRDDSILVQCGKDAYFHAELAQAFWPKAPVILECEHYGSSKRRGCWGDGSLYLQAVEDYHASYASIHWWPQEFLEANRELIGRMNLRLGYRLQLVEASWPGKVSLGEPVHFAAKWRNAGVAPCLPGGYPAVTLKDSAGGIVGVYVDESFDVRSLPVGKPGRAEVVGQELTFTLSPLLHGTYRPGVREPGEHQVFISVGTRTGTPRIALPLAGDDGRRRYRLGALKATPAGTQ